MEDSLRLQLEENAIRKGTENCDLCNGLGYYFDPLGGGRDSGSFLVCRCMVNSCSCNGEPPYEYYELKKNAMVSCPARPARIAVERINQLQSISGIPARYRWKFIDSVLFNDLNREELLMAFDHSVQTILKFGIQKNQGIYFYGKTGCGKTLLSCAILNELIRLYQVPVKYAKISRDVLGRLRASFNPNSELYGEGREIEEKLASIQALVIDDFGVHKESEWVNSVLYDLIDSRYENNLLTIFTANESMDSWLEISDGRVYSRIKEMCIEIHIEAPDYRLLESKSY